MKISHRELRLFLRIFFCIGLFFGVIAFIYAVFLQRILNIICYICYLIATGAVLFLLFARKRPSHRFAYGTFYGMCFMSVLFFVSYIYDSATVVSKITNELVDVIENESDPTRAIESIVRNNRFVFE